jgi:sulfur-carrier protein
MKTGMRVRMFATLRDLLRTKEVTIEIEDETSVRQVLRRLVAAHPVLAGKLWDDNEKLTGLVTVLLNGRSLEYMNGLETTVQDDDSLSLFPPVGGG